MGLTFQQKFYMVPEAYFVYSDSELFAIVEIPDDEDECLDLENKLKQHGYVFKKIDFDNLVINGYNLVENI